MAYTLLPFPYPFYTLFCLLFLPVFELGDVLHTDCTSGRQIGACEACPPSRRGLPPGQRLTVHQDKGLHLVKPCF